MYTYPDDILKVLEFERIRERIVRHCRCEGSRTAAAAIAPISDTVKLNEELSRAEEYRLTLESGGYFPDFLFEEFLPEARLLRKRGSMLTETQFDRIRSGSITVNALLKFLRTHALAMPFLNILSSEIPETEEVIEAIDQTIDRQSQVRSSASPELQRIRSELASKRREAEKRFRSFINDLKKRGWLRENEENFYNNRRVLAVPSEYKKELQGIIHGKSDSGKTTFIEPSGMVELNNEVAELELDERNEVFRLLRLLSDELRPHAGLIEAYAVFLAQMDLIRAKAIFAREINARVPEIRSERTLHLVNAYHPLLFLQNRSSGKEIIPLNVTLDDSSRILIISGPNAGGKSITLKTVGLLQLMLQSGLPVPVAAGSAMSFFGILLADVGDSQSIEYALSTYSSRLIRMNHFLRMASSSSMVLIDEFGTGTEPESGGAIAEVILEELNRRKTFGIFTTHYSNVKLLADRLEGVRNASMQFDPESLKPLYKLLVGSPGSSYAFEVAEKIGLPKHVLDRARKKIRKEQLRLNDLLSALQKDKYRLEQELSALKLQKDKTEAAEARFEQMKEKLESKLDKERGRSEETRRLNELGRKLERLSEEWSKSKDKKPVIKKFAGLMTAEFKKKLSENTPERVERRRIALVEQLKKEIEVGSKVRIMKSRQVGTVEKIRKSDVVVDFGNIKATVAFENLEIYKEKEKDKDKK